MLSLKSKSESEIICLMVLFLSNNSYAPGGSCTSKYTVSNSGIFMEICWVSKLWNFAFR